MLILRANGSLLRYRQKEDVMKYKDKVIIVAIISFLILGMSYAVDAYQSLLRIEDKVIRLHVIAHSNRIEDQELKLEVRNKIIEKSKDIFEDIHSKEESERIIIQKLDEIKHIAEKVIKDHHYDYSIDVYYGNYSFPRKQYNQYVLPAGKYDAIRIVIGDGKGDNWWCVMFPPLCFVDFGKVDEESEEAFDKQTEEKLSEILTEEEIELIKINRGLTKIKLKSKIAEWITRGKIENAGLEEEKETIKAYAVDSITWGAKGDIVKEIQRKLKDCEYYD